MSVSCLGYVTLRLTLYSLFLRPRHSAHHSFGLPLTFVMSGSGADRSWNPFDSPIHGNATFGHQFGYIGVSAAAQHTTSNHASFGSVSSRQAQYSHSTYASTASYGQTNWNYSGYAATYGQSANQNVHDVGVAGSAPSKFKAHASAPSYERPKDATYGTQAPFPQFSFSDKGGVFDAAWLHRQDSGILNDAVGSDSGLRSQGASFGNDHEDFVYPPIRTAMEADSGLQRSPFATSSFGTPYKGTTFYPFPSQTPLGNAFTGECNYGKEDLDGNAFVEDSIDWNCGEPVFDVDNGFWFTTANYKMYISPMQSNRWKRGEQPKLRTIMTEVLKEAFVMMQTHEASKRESKCEKESKCEELEYKRKEIRSSTFTFRILCVVQLRAEREEIHAKRRRFVHQTSLLNCWARSTRGYRSMLKNSRDSSRANLQDISKLFSLISSKRLVLFT